MMTQFKKKLNHADGDRKRIQLSLACEQKTRQLLWH